MKFAIIAAGEGSRLSHEGVAQPKPLVPLLGEPMIERLIRIFTACGATEIVVITNEQFVEVQQALACLQKTAPLRIVVKTTPSSMHSLHAISDYLRGEPFCLTTVDTIFHEDDFKKYIHHFLTHEELDGCMAVTPYVDDEKPLWVGADSHLHITGFHDAQEANDHLISGGIYCLKDKALDVLDHCMEKGLHRMRNFQRQLVAEGLNLEAYPIEKILNVDHKGDIDKAEAFLRQEGAMRLVGVCRSNVFSPNCVDSDLAIMHAVAAKLRDMGNEVRLCNENELKDCAALASADGFFNMGRSKEALAVLAQQEEQGKGVVNSARGIDSCIREKMSHLLIDNGVSYPKSWFIAHDRRDAGRRELPLLAETWRRMCTAERGHLLRAECRRGTTVSGGFLAQRGDLSRGKRALEGRLDEVLWCAGHGLLLLVLPRPSGKIQVRT